MKFQKSLALIIFLGLSLGCPVAKIDAVVDKSTNYSINEIHIVTDGPGKGFSELFAEFLSRKFEKINIKNTRETTNLSKPKKLSLENENNSEPSPVEKILASTKEPYTIIANITSLTAQNGIAQKIEIEISIYSKEFNKFIWKSNASIEPGTFYGATQYYVMNPLADKVIEQLRADHLIK